MGSGTVRHAMDQQAMGQCWCPLRHQRPARRGVSGPHGRAPEHRRHPAMGDTPDPEPASNPEAPKEPTRLKRLKRLLVWGRRKSKDSPPTQGTPDQGAEGETP